MFIDFLALDLVNLVIALVLVALYFVFYVEKDSQKVGPGFLVTGFIATITGLDIITHWPLPGQANVVFGEPMVMFGVILFFAGLAVIRGWDMLSIGVVTVFAGLIALVLGVKILSTGYTKSPAMSGIAYLLTGIGAILSLPAYVLRKNMVLRIVVAVVLIIAAILFAIEGYGSYWQHPDSFSKWAPATMAH